MKQNDPAIALILTLTFVLVLASGCIGMVQNAVSGGSEESVSSSDSAVVPTLAASSGTVMPVPPAPTVVPTATQHSLVVSTDPVVPYDPYANMTQHASRINNSGTWKNTWPEPEYSNTFYLRYNATGLRVNVIDGPLYLDFIPNPLYDCMTNKDSCRKVNPPFFQITVRDADTGVILEQDGYGRTFESNLSGTRNRIVVYREGPMDLTLYGNNVNVQLNIATGAAYRSSGGSAAAAVAASGTPPPEQLYYG